MDDDDEFVSEAQSLHGNSEEDNSDPIISEEEDESDPLNDAEDPNPASDNIDVTEMINTFKHVQKALSGFSKIVEKVGKPRHSRVQTRSETSTRTVGRGKGKSSVAAGTSERRNSERPGSRFNSRYFGEKIIAKLDGRKRKIIRDRGFGILLEYDGCSSPKGFVQWIADQVDINCGDIVVGGKVIPFDPLSVHLFLGIPIGGEDIEEKYTDSTKTKFLEEIKLTSLPSIKIFGEKLLGETLSDDDVFRYFMVVALSTFLCANSNTYPSPQYLGALIDVSKVKECNWSKFVHEWMFNSIRNYRKKGRDTIGGCRYFLAGYYLDFVTFGGPKRLPVDMPRIYCWKGLMIKKYSSYDCVSGSTYGKRPVKSFDDTVYAQKYLDEEAYANFRNTIDKHCDFLRRRDKDAMSKIFKEHQTRLGYTCPDTLVAKMFKYIQKAYAPRGGTDANAEFTSSAGRAASPRHGNGDDEGVDPLCDEYEAPLPSPAHADVLKDGFVDTMIAGTSNIAVKEADVVVAATNNAIMEDVHLEIPATTKTNEEVDSAVGVNDQIVEDVEGKSACAAKSHERESSATDILESDGLYDGPGNDNHFFSQSTEIISESNSSHHDSVGIHGKRKRIASTQSSSDAASGPMKRKRRSKGSEALNPHNAVSMSPRKMSLRHSTRLSGIRPISGVGATMENPLDVDEAPVQTSKSTRKGKPKDNSSSPSIQEVSLDVSLGADAMNGKRKRNTSQSSSAANVSPKSRRVPSKQLGRSPLSRVENANDGVKNGEIASIPVAVHSEAAARPSLDIVQKAPGQGCSIRNASVSPNQAGHIVHAVKNAQRASGPVLGHEKETQLDELGQRAFSAVPGHQIQTQLDEHAAPAEPQIGKPPPVDKHCMKKPIVQFNSPSMPSFRMFEDEDDFGNFIEDPKLRRSFPTTRTMSCPVERARSFLQGLTSTSCPVGGARSAMPSGVAVDVHQEVNSGEQNWVFVDKWYNPALRNEETIVTENDGTEVIGNVETVHLHMVSLPFTEYSENAEVSATPAPALIPLAAISSTGAPLHIAPIVTPSARYQESSVPGGSTLSARNIGSNNISNGSDSLSSQGAWQSSSAKLAVHRPRRQFIPSKYKLSPYMRHESKIKVSRLEADVYGVVLNMAESTEHSDLPVIDYRCVVVLLSALASSLRPQGKVKYFVVNAFCRLMFLRNHPNSSYKHYFFSKVGDYLIGNHGIDDCKKNELYENAVRSFKGAKTAKYLPHSHYLYFPILFNEHWYVVVVYFTNKWICILDSCTLRFGVDSAFYKAVHDEFVPNLIKVWKQAVGFEFGFQGYKIWFPDVPQQNDNLSDDDSGIFALKNLELYQANVDMMSKYTEDDIAHLRIKFVNEMIWNAHNIAHDGRAKVEQYDPEVYDKYYKRA